jgi:hypothetical protein
MSRWTLNEIFRRWPGLWFRIAFETAVPALAAIIWGTTALIAGKDIFAAHNYRPDRIRAANKGA